MTRLPDMARAETAACELILRENLSLPVRPMALLRARARLCAYEEAAEWLGLSAAEFERRYGGADAFTVRRGGEWLVCYRADGRPTRLRFTLAHELGHVVLGHESGRPAEEREADHFASCLLCPTPVCRRLAAVPGLRLEDAAALCYVSAAAMGMAMKRGCPPVDETLLRRVDERLAPALAPLLRMEETHR